MPRATTAYAGSPRPDEVPETAAPSAGQIRLIRGCVAAEVAQTYPEFAASKLGYRAA